LEFAGPDFGKQPLRGILPSTLTDLTVSSNEPFGMGDLPPSLTSLKTPASCLSHLQPGLLPSSLVRLYLSTFHRELRPGELPSGLTCLDLINYDDALIPGVLSLCFVLF